VLGRQKQPRWRRKGRRPGREALEPNPSGEEEEGPQAVAVVECVLRPASWKGLDATGGEVANRGDEDAGPE